jgi:fructoselysine-6-P-deglycase FrlB-like protein
MSYIFQEIHAQYESLDQTRRLVDGEIVRIHDLIASKPLVFIGSGSSYAVARSAALMARLRLGNAAIAIPAGDLLLHMDAYRPALHGCVLVALSRSGETSEVVRAIDAMRGADIRFQVMGVICSSFSTLSGQSDLPLEMPWAFDESVCQTRTVSSLFFFSAYMTAKLAGDEALTKDLIKAVHGGPDYMRRVEPTLEEVARKPWTHAVVLGDAELGGLCEEGALAFKEICQLPSNYYHLLDVRHGPMVLVGPETLVIAVLSSNDNELELALLGDMMKRGATVVAYSDMPLNLPGVISLSFGETLLPPARGLPAIAICQLVSYHKSFLTGVNPDEPNGLSPWIRL